MITGNRIIWISLCLPFAVVAMPLGFFWWIVKSSFQTGEGLAKYFYEVSR